MALLVVDFSFLDGRDGEIVVKELALADSHSNRISSYLFKSPYTWGKFRPLTLDSITLWIMAAIGTMDTYCIQSWRIYYTVELHQPLQFIASGLRSLHLLAV
jgi:hypothetical protein